MKLPGAVVAALQQALGAENAAIYGYDALGPRLPASDTARARTSQAAHRALRDALFATLTRAGAVPAAAAAAYALPALDTAGHARSYAGAIEETCCRQWRYAVAVAARHDSPASASVRASAVTNLTASALRTAAWRAVIDPTRAPDVFPGV